MPIRHRNTPVPSAGIRCSKKRTDVDLQLGDVLYNPCLPKLSKNIDDIYTYYIHIIYILYTYNIHINLHIIYILYT